MKNKVLFLDFKMILNIYLSIKKEEPVFADSSIRQLFKFYGLANFT